LAVAAGATVIATSSSDEKLRFAKSLGATHTINYRTTPDWATEVQRLTGGKGVDHVVDVGGAGTIEQSLQSVRQGGLVSVVGVLSPTKAADLVPALLFGGKIGKLCILCETQLWDLTWFTSERGACDEQAYDRGAGSIGRDP